MRIRKNLRLLLFLIIAILTFVSINPADTHSNSGGAPSGKTGSPGDGGTTCATSCHTGTAVTTQTGWITSTIPPTGYVPGTTYTITATVTAAGHNRYGFEISPQNPAGTFLGTLVVTDPTNTAITALHYITHTGAGTIGSTGSHTWNFNWTAPVVGSGAVTFYGAFNATDHDNTDSGDQIFKSTLVVNECSAPVTPGVITGLTTTCNNSNNVAFSVGTVSGASSYTWTVPSGSSVASGQGTNSITVNFGTTSGNVCVTATSACGTSTASCHAVTLQGTPAQPGTITSADTVCGGQSGINFKVAAVAGASTYTWTVPSGSSITSGQGTDSIFVTFGNTSGAVCVTAGSSCGTSIQKCKNIVVSNTPSAPAITGDSTVCSNSTMTYCCPLHTGSTYAWTVANGTVVSGQGTHCITISTGTPGAASVSVTETTLGLCVTSTGTYNLLISPPPAKPSITFIADTMVSSLAAQYKWFRNGIMISGTQQKLRILAPGNYQVQITDSNGCTAISDSTSFFASINQIQFDNKLSVAPNPFNESLFVTYLLSKDENVLIELYDLVGRKTSTFVDEHQVHGMHTISFFEQVSNLKSGIYFMKLQLGEESKIVKVLKSE